MTPSASVAKFIKLQEGFRPHAYYATEAEKSRGIVTIGYGTTGAGITIDMEWDEPTASAQFDADLADFGTAVWAQLGMAETTQCQFDAMVSLAYNIGIPNFASSSIASNHRLGHYSTAALAFGLWNKQRGADGVLRVVPGLTQRRAAEASIYEGNSYLG